MRPTESITMPEVLIDQADLDESDFDELNKQWEAEIDKALEEEFDQEKFDKLCEQEFDEEDLDAAERSKRKVVLLTKHNALRAGDWDGYLWAGDSCDRLDDFLALASYHRLPDREYWRLLAQVWIDTEFPSLRQATWLSLFARPRGEREHLMKPEEHAAFIALPNPVRIFRGVKNPKHERGMSWTVDKKKAHWFANRAWFGKGSKGGVVMTTVVPKGKVLAYFSERAENEIVIDPRGIGVNQLTKSARAKR